MREDASSYQENTCVRHCACPPQPKPSSSNRFLFFILGVLLTLVLFGLGYMACIRAGLFSGPDEYCCLYIEFD